MTNQPATPVRVIYGRAEYLPGMPADADVRRYGSEPVPVWIGTDTYDVDYYVDLETAQLDLPWLNAADNQNPYWQSLTFGRPIRSYAFLDACDSEGRTARERLDHVETADVEFVDGDWPDYDVYDPHTGELVHAGIGYND